MCMYLIEYIVQLIWSIDIYVFSRWWFQIFVYFHPEPWGNFPIFLQPPPRVEPLNRSTSLPTQKKQPATTVRAVPFARRMGVNQIESVMWMPEVEGWKMLSYLDVPGSE